MTIVSVLLALFADAVLNSVATTRQGYLTQFGRYLDTRYPADRTTARRPS